MVVDILKLLVVVFTSLLCLYLVIFGELFAKFWGISVGLLILVCITKKVYEADCAAGELEAKEWAKEWATKKDE